MDYLKLMQQATLKNMLLLTLILVLLTIALTVWKITSLKDEKMDTSALTAARDKLNADIGTLLAGSTADQATIDKLTSEVSAVDADVVTALTPPPPPPPPPPLPLDFTAFNAAASAFAADTKLTQAQIDAATAALVAATV
jgi:hypothetical protein